MCDFFCLIMFAFMRLSLIIIQIKYGVVHWRGEEYRSGTCVFLTPTTFRFKTYGNVFKGFKGSKSEKVGTFF